MKKFTLEEFKNYLKSQDSMGDIFYNLSEENIEKAQKQIPLLEIYHHMVNIRECDDYSDEEQFDEIFALAKQMPHIDYCDPDTSFEEDMDAYLKAVRDYLKYDLGIKYID